MKKQFVFFYFALTSIITVNAQQVNFPELTGPYLGQKPPAAIPEIFAPGIIPFGNHEHHTNFSLIGKEMFDIGQRFPICSINRCA